LAAGASRGEEQGKGSSKCVLGGGSWRGLLGLVERPCVGRLGSVGGTSKASTGDGGDGVGTVPRRSQRRGTHACQDTRRES
jgi:hypothetical protein